MHQIVKKCSTRCVYFIVSSRSSQNKKKKSDADKAKRENLYVIA